MLSTTLANGVAPDPNLHRYFVDDEMLGPFAGLRNARVVCDWNVNVDPPDVSAYPLSAVGTHGVSGLSLAVIAGEVLERPSKSTTVTEIVKKPREGRANVQKRRPPTGALVGVHRPSGFWGVVFGETGVAVTW